MRMPWYDLFWMSRLLPVILRVFLKTLRHWTIQLLITTLVLLAPPTSIR